jgi:hypothetical protein
VIREVATPAEIPGPAAAPPVTGGIIAPDPFTLSTDELDNLFDLGQLIVSVVHEIDRQTHRFLVMLAEFDARRGWELGGHSGCADWLAHETGMDRRSARGSGASAGPMR